MKLTNKTLRSLPLCAAASLALLLDSSASAETLLKFDFNEGSGTTVTSESGSLVGSFGGLLDPNNYPVLVPDAPSAAANDNALTINDPNGYLVANASSVTNFNDFSKPLTVEAWVRIPETAAARNEGIVGYGSSWKLGFRNDGRLAFTLFGVVDATVDVYPALGTWTHIASVWEPGVGITYYVDGFEAASFPETRPMRAAMNSNLGIGSAGTAEPINATIDRVRIHQALLTPEELDSVATEPKPVYPSTLAAFDFDEAAPPFQSEGQLTVTAENAQDLLLASGTPLWITESPSKRTGDNALLFDGGDRVRVEDPAQEVTLDTGDFTLQAWVKPGAQPGTKGVLFFNNGPGGAFAMAITSDRHVMLTTLGIADTRSEAIVPDDSLWHHVAVIHRNGTDLRFFVDGVLQDTIDYTGGVLMTRTETFFSIGSENNGGLAFNGGIDRVQLDNTALEVSALDSLAIPGVIPGTPELEIGLAVSVAWPTDATGFVLESTTSLTEPRVWTVVGTAPVVVADKFYVLLPTPAEETFYRLVRPTAEE